MEEKPRGPSGYYTTDPISEPPVVDDFPIGPAVLETIEPTEDFLRVQIESSAREKLALTDWMVLRSIETGKPISQAWRTYREALREIVRGKSQKLPMEPEKS